MKMTFRALVYTGLIRLALALPALVAASATASILASTESTINHIKLGVLDWHRQDQPSEDKGYT